MSRKTITKASLVRISAWALCAVPLIVAVEHHHQSLSPNLQAGEGGLFDRPAHEKAEAERVRAMHQNFASDEEWKKAEAFLQEYAPKRLFHVERNPTGEPTERVKHFLINRWKPIANLEKTSPQLYKTKVQEVKLEDDLFGVCLEIKRHPSEKSRLEAQLKGKIGDLFELGLTERKLRIELLDRALADQKIALVGDEKNKDQLINRRFLQVITEGVEGARLDKGPLRPSNKPKDDASTHPSLGEGESSGRSNPPAP